MHRAHKSAEKHPNGVWCPPFSESSLQGLSPLLIYFFIWILLSCSVVTEPDPASLRYSIQQELSFAKWDFHAETMKGTLTADKSLNLIVLHFAAVESCERCEKKRTNRYGNKSFKGPRNWCRCAVSFAKLPCRKSSVTRAALPISTHQRVVSGNLCSETRETYVLTQCIWPAEC